MNFDKIRDLCLKILLGETDFTALKYGRFHGCGELHKFMYDRILIEDILQDIGFSNIIIQSHSQSNIPNWNVYGLDSTSTGQARKPDSLYMEAIKSS